MSIQEKKFYYNSLFYDYIFSYEKLKNYFHYDFHTAENFKKRVEYLSANYDNGFRAMVSDRLVHINKNFGCSEAAIKNCESLKDPNTLVVIGGQQPGLLTGPAFIIYKIFTIIKLAEKLSDYLNLKVVPVFWNASDDSNFSQVNNTFLTGKELKKVELNPAEITGAPDDKSSIRFSDIIISQEIASKKIDELMGLLPETDFKAGIDDFFKDCLKRHLKRLSKSDFQCSNSGDSPGLSKAGCPPPDDSRSVNDSGHTNCFKLNDFFSAIITGLFSKYGLVLIDPSDTELKKLSLPLLEKDICNHGNTEQSINKSGEKLVKEGYHSQLSADKDFLNFFIVKDGVRRRIKCGKDLSYVFDKMSFSENDLKSLIVSDFSKISLNVVLRPLFQDMVLPVLATVCGPGEVSYFAQLKEVYNVFGTRQPVIYPRFSATIVENKVKKAIKKTGIGFELLNYGVKDALGIVLKRSLGIDVDGILKSLEDDLMFKSGKAEGLVNNYGIDCAGYFDRLKDNLKKEIKILTKKIYSEIENKNSLMALNTDKIYLNLLPGGLLQERVINIFHYINKYDFKLMDDLYDIIDVDIGSNTDENLNSGVNVNMDAKNRLHKLIFL